MVERITDSVVKERETVIMMISVLDYFSVVKTTVFIRQVDSGIILMTVVREDAVQTDPVTRDRVHATLTLTVSLLEHILSVVSSVSTDLSTH